MPSTNYAFARALGALLLLLASFQVPAADPTPPGAEKVTSAAGYPGLRHQLSNTGRTRVIVTLALPFRPEGYLPDDAARTQAADIAMVQADLLQRLAVANVAVDQITQFRYVPQVALTLDEAGLAQLLASPLVLSVAEDEMVTPDLNLSVPRVGAPTVWSQGITGSGIAVAVVDTGVDKNHPFLSGSVVAEACYSGAGYPAGTSCGTGCTIQSVCPGGVASSIAAGSALPYAGSCGAGTCDHGTHVAGIIAGRNNGIYTGVAPGAGIIAIQAFTRVDSVTSCSPRPSPCVSGYYSDLMLSLQRVLDLRTSFTIAAVNMSLGGGRYYANCDSDPLKPLIDTLRSYNIAAVISSGNAGYKDSMGAPGCVSSAISVGATTDGDGVASYSNSASFLHLLAPGSSITASIPGTAFAEKDGTSMAAPHVAGAWALLRQASPSSTVTQVANALITTGLSITDTNGLAKPRIRIDQALVTLAPPAPPGSAKVGVFRGGFFFLDVNGNGRWDNTPTDRFLPFGLPSDQPVIGDWNGDGRPKVGVFRDGFFFLDYNGNGVWDGSVVDRFYPFGAPGDIPVVGDWNHNGRAKIGVYRMGFWFLDHNGNGRWDGAPGDLFYAFGSPGDRPVVGDWSGNGYWKVGVFRNGFWFLDYNGNGRWDGSFYDIYYVFGTAGDVPVAGDWNNNSLSKVGVFRNGFWFLDQNGTGTWQGSTVDRFFAFGMSFDFPVVGKGSF